jgi:ribosomal-protein-alanine N-acetyltransferase
MTPADIDRVMDIAGSLKEAPHWPRAAYTAALDREATPRRIALVIENSSVVDEAAEKLGISGNLDDEHPAGAKAQQLFWSDFGTTEVVPCYKTNQQLQTIQQLLKKQKLRFPEAGAKGEVRVAGFAVACLLPPEAELELIAVDLAAQRQGVAFQIFAGLAEELCAAQVNEVALEVRASNLAALALYRKLGFIESGRRKDYYQIPVEDALLMRLVF